MWSDTRDEKGWKEEREMILFFILFILIIYL